MGILLSKTSQLEAEKAKRLRLQKEESQARVKKFDEYLKKNLVGIYPPPEVRFIKTTSRMPTKEAPQHFQKVKLSAKPVEGTNESIVNASDGREQVLTTTQWPYSVHGLVSWKFKDDRCYGTGIMIGPNIVLTAGHNLYRSKDETYPDLASMQFLPAANGRVLPFGCIKIEKYFVSPNYIKEGKEDYGMLFLKESIGDLTGYFGLACLEPEEIKTKKINVTGYPSDKIASKPKTYEMWGMEGEASCIDEVRGLISYMIDTVAGQSGSGVWYQEGEKFYICGVHILGTNTVNSATLLTRAVYQQIYMWIQQMGFNDYLLHMGETKKLEFINQEITTECIEILIDYKLDDLSVLDLLMENIGTEGAKALAQNISWINLSRLDLSHNNIGAEGAKALAQNISWISLSQLDLFGNNIDTEGAKALAQNISWINLSQLDLSLNNIDAEGAKALAQNISWINLSVLKLSANNIGTEGAKALAQNTSWINLSQLYLYVNSIGAEGAKALAQNISWVNLSQLYLDWNNIDAEGAKALAQNISWINLSRLDLSDNNIGAEGAKALAQNTSWINLSRLDLSLNNIGAEGAKALAQNISWINLSQLDLSHNSIGAEGAKALAKSTSWINLSQLVLSHNNIGTEGAKALAQNTSWINLSQLNLSNNKVDAEGAKAIEQNKIWKLLKKPVF